MGKRAKLTVEITPLRKRIKIEKVEGEEGVICVFVERVLGTGMGWGRRRS